MINEKSALTVFMERVLNEFSVIGQFAVFFGTILVLSAVLILGKVRLLAGIDLLLLLAIADWIWRHRDPHPEMFFPNEPVAPHRRRHAYRCCWAATFFLAFVGLAVYILRLPSIVRFLTAE